MLIQNLVADLSLEFTMKNLGELSYVLGFEAHKTFTCLHLR